MLPAISLCSWGACNYRLTVGCFVADCGSERFVYIICYENVVDTSHQTQDSMGSQ